MTDAPTNEHEPHTAAAEHDEPPARPPLTRSSRHRVVAGVCGGLGRYLDIDPVVFRVVVAVLGLTGGLGLFLYGLAWLVVPREAVDANGGDGDGGRSEVQRVLTGRVDGQSIGAVLLTVIGTGVFFSSMGDGDQLFPLLLLGGLVFLAVRYDPERRRRAHGEPGPAAPGPRDRLADSGEQLDWSAWGRRFSEDLREEWAVRSAEMHRRMSEAHRAHAEARATGQVPSDTPAAGPSGYLWDPRHPERNPYQGATPPPGAVGAPGAPHRAWWQRTDLPEGDPLRKRPAEQEPVPAPVKVVKHRSYLGPLAVLAAIGAGAGVALIGRHHPGLPLTAVLAAALLPLGLALLIGTRYGRVRGLTVPALLLTLALAGSAGSAATVDATFGDRSWTVTSAAELQSHYSLGAGDMKLDLSQLDPAGGTLGTEVRVGAGDLLVTVPSDVVVKLTVRNGLGEVTLPDGQKISGGGTDRDVEVQPTGGRTSKGTLDLTVLVGLGNAKVVQG